MKKKERLLEKYIEKKLDNEERQRLLTKLSKEASERNILKTQLSSPTPVLPPKKKTKIKPVAVQVCTVPRIEHEVESSCESDSFDEFLIPRTTSVPLVPVCEPEEEDGYVESRSLPVDCGQIPAVFRIFERSEEVIQQRQLLPILGEEHRIVDMIRYNDISILGGETGCGKTTQVPQFLLEAGYSGIAVTQPRRVSAVAAAKRVAYELGRSDLVGYHIRFDKQPTSLLAFMTDGILLRFIKADFLLNDFSVVILDEAHERGLNTDLLMGLLSRIVPLRRKHGNPLKLIIMSATIDVSLFNCPKIEIETRQFPISIHWSKITPSDPIESAYHKIIQIHNKLPSGGILVFVSGQSQVLELVERLRGEIGNSGSEYDIEDSEAHDAALVSKGMKILPLYAMLPVDEQMYVFEPTEDRLVVVATNVAETSITIPGIRYVVDTGLEKRRFYRNGIGRFEVGWTTKPSAVQRAGRAGRTGAGHVYRLYSAPLFEDLFDDVPEPEILRVPIENVVLELKSMHIENIGAFPFVTAPSGEAIERAERLLCFLGALGASRNISEIGRLMSLFPLSPRFSRMIVSGFSMNITGLLPLLLDVVAALSSECISWTESREKFCEYWDSVYPVRSDVLVAMIVFQEYRILPAVSRNEFCSRLSLNYKNMEEARKVRLQLERVLVEAFVNVDMNDLKGEGDRKLYGRVVKLVFESYQDQLARRVVSQEGRFEYLVLGLADCGLRRLEEIGTGRVDKFSLVKRGPEPEWVFYLEAIENTSGKLVLVGVSVVDCEMVAQSEGCFFDVDIKLIDADKNLVRYCENKDEMVMGCVPRLGLNEMLVLPSTEISMMKILGTGAYCHKEMFVMTVALYSEFGRAVLEGRVVGEPFSSFCQQYSLSPGAMSRPFQRNVSKCVAVRQMIQMNGIMNRKALCRMWRTNPSFLLNEWLLWIPVDLQSAATLAWRNSEDQRKSE